MSSLFAQVFEKESERWKTLSAGLGGGFIFRRGEPRGKSGGGDERAEDEWRSRQTASHPTGSLRLDVGHHEGVVVVREAQAVGGARGQALQLVEGLSGVHLFRPLPLAAVTCRRNTDVSAAGFVRLQRLRRRQEVPFFLR